MSKFLDKSDETRDVENDGSRFWTLADPNDGPYATMTVGIVDDNEGGIVAFCHEDNADRIVEAFRAFTGEI